MSMSFNIQADDFYSKLRQLEENIPGASQRIMEQVALKTEAKAKELCPVGETGALRASIGSETGMENGVATAMVYADTDYAEYVHEGIGQAPQPFLDSAVRSEGMRLIHLVKQELFNG